MSSRGHFPRCPVTAFRVANELGSRGILLRRQFSGHGLHSRNHRNVCELHAAGKAGQACAGCRLRDAPIDPSRPGTSREGQKRLPALWLAAALFHTSMHFAELKFDVHSLQLLAQHPGPCRGLADLRCMPFELPQLRHVSDQLRSKELISIDAFHSWRFNEASIRLAPRQKDDG